MLAHVQEFLREGGIFSYALLAVLGGMGAIALERIRTLLEIQRLPRLPDLDPAALAALRPLIRRRLEALPVLALVATIIPVILAMAGPPRFSAIALATPEQKTALLTMHLPGMINTSLLGGMVALTGLLLHMALTAWAARLEAGIELSLHRLTPEWAPLSRRHGRETRRGRLEAGVLEAQLARAHFGWLVLTGLTVFLGVQAWCMVDYSRSPRFFLSAAGFPPVSTSRREFDLSCALLMVDPRGVALEGQRLVESPDGRLSPAHLETITAALKVRRDLVPRAEGPPLMILAHRDLAYERLYRLIEAGLSAGFGRVHLAVVAP